MSTTTTKTRLIETLRGYQAKQSSLSNRCSKLLDSIHKAIYFEKWDLQDSLEEKLKTAKNEWDQCEVHINSIIRKL